ncbi:flagellar hook-associated protein FlgL [Clostridium ihumii]|uniref:flagellar hook-associated protein FlgL n=1 Tax=Clostridium ihumii TaxID=1470356 RepID=UPI00058D87EE|nr:flagellar hook-associated protein FlgL [Clostridium ihumii]
MRITTSMMTNTFLGDMNVNLNNMSNRQKQLNTGKEFSKPSDSPYKAARSMQMYSEIYSNEQYNTNISHTVNWLDTTDTAMNSLGNALTRIRELMVSAGNGSYGEDELKSIKDEISEKTNEISQILNTSFDGKYIFGGTKGEKPSSVNDKGEIVAKDQGDTLKVEISQGVVIDYSINADEILNFQHEVLKEKLPDGTGGSIIKLDKNGNTLRINSTTSNLIDNANNNVLYDGKPISVDSEGNLKGHDGTVLKVDKSNGKLQKEDGTYISPEIKIDNKIEVIKSKETGELGKLLSDITNSLESGDASNVTGEYLSKIDSAISNVLSVRSKVGTLQNRMEGAETINKSQNTNLKEILSHNEDIDWVEKSMEMATVQTIYMASLQSSARILQNSLLDYVR